MKKKISHRHLGPLRGSSPPFSTFSQQGLNPIKPVYDPDQPDGRLNLTASSFNQMGQCTSSPGRRGYCYAELAVFFPSGGRNHCQYSLRLPTEGRPGYVGLGGWLRSEIVYLPKGSHPPHY